MLNIIHVICKIIFGHDTGGRFLIVRAPTLKTYYAKTIKDRAPLFVEKTDQSSITFVLIHIGDVFVVPFCPPPLTPIPLRAARVKNFLT